MFPKKLDGADVLYFTDSGHYGNFIHYLAICSYSHDDRYYLFCCDRNKEVINDYLCDTIEECMNIFKNVDWRSAE